MKKLLLLFIWPLLCISCNKKKFFDGPNNYSDGFENYSSTDDLVADGDNKWSFFQLTYANNNIALDSTIKHSGDYSLRFFADPTINGDASKSSVVKQKMAFWDKDIVSIDAWYFLSGNNPKQWLFLMDLEEQTAVGAGPGIRIALVDEQLLVEHKFPNPNIKQEGNGIEFPRNEWVNIRMEVKLSQKKKGYIKVWQNDELIISQDKWKTLPKDVLYGLQGTKGVYSSIEFGATANTSDSQTTIYIDDIEVKILN